MPRTEPFDLHADQYEHWFVRFQPVFRSELTAIRKVLPDTGEGIEIGLGSGIFAEPLGIKQGVEPSEVMRKKAEERGIRAVKGVAENLPYGDRSFDFALMVTTICFVDDVHASFHEAGRVLKDNGSLIIGFVDKDSPLGKKYLKHQNENIFYREAEFYSVGQLCGILNDTGFRVLSTWQTVFGELDQIKTIQAPRRGFGKGGFVVIEAKKTVKT